MDIHHRSFDEQEVLQRLKHYLPSQAPLKDFVHHNTLHAFQHEPFHQGLQAASELFGCKVYPGLEEFRMLYRQGKISDRVLDVVLAEKEGTVPAPQWKQRLLEKNYNVSLRSRIGGLRECWKTHFRVNLDKKVHPLLFRLTAAFLDQGISIWKFPGTGRHFLAAIKHLERNSFIHIFKSRRIRHLLLHEQFDLRKLLEMLVGDECLFEQYLFDQQFAHPGWSGMVAVLEGQPESLLDKRKISLHDFIALELLLELDFLDRELGGGREPLAKRLDAPVPVLFREMAGNELFEAYALWQEAMEWTYYDPVLKGLQCVPEEHRTDGIPRFQALCCIDDRTAAFRMHLEKAAPGCETFGTAGFFNVEFYFQPEHARFFTKSCPAPLSPGYLIRETEARKRHATEAHFSRHSQGFFSGWLISPTLGFWSALKLAGGIFKPAESPVMVSSFKHMDREGRLSVECNNPEQKEHGLQVGFTVAEMAERIEGLLRSIGLTGNFAPLVYVIGHGASSVNNTHYAGYDCGACSGRPGSVNARVAAFMANHLQVRKLLAGKGIVIPGTTRFVGALHDTTRDEVDFFDIKNLSSAQQQLHNENITLFHKALALNAKERSRRFLLLNSKKGPEKIHEKVKLRALSLFEPRPEWNHATNALCIIGRRETNRHLFTDRRAFLNSYDYSLDPDGTYLLGILKAVSPVCGGINLEYYFSRVDNARLGAGTKLPHNVIGLIGVANGMDGDLRPGLPRQMIDIHNPLRLMVIVEHDPEVVLNTVRQHPSTFEWFANEWIHLIALHPESRDLFRFRNNQFIPYHPLASDPEPVSDLEKLFESSGENLPVCVVS